MYEKDLDNQEIIWISYCRSIYQDLLNVTNGGEGTSGCKHSRESIEKTRQKLIGRKMSKEFKEKNRQSQLGRHQSETTIEKLRQINLGKNNPNYNKPPWNKGLTKETDERIAAYGIKDSKRQRGVKKGPRAQEHIKTGENNSNAKLTEKEIIEIRRKYNTKEVTGYHQLAEIYHVCFANIRDIIKFKTWKNIM